MGSASSTCTEMSGSGARDAFIGGRGTPRQWMTRGELNRKEQPRTGCLAVGCSRASSSRSAVRDANAAAYRSNFQGFRIARTQTGTDSVLIVGMTAAKRVLDAAAPQDSRK